MASVKDAETLLTGRVMAIVDEFALEDQDRNGRKVRKGDFIGRKATILGDDTSGACFSIVKIAPDEAVQVEPMGLILWYVRNTGYTVGAGGMSTKFVRVLEEADLEAIQSVFLGQASAAKAA